MPRNLDLTALRSFVTVAETGGVTRAAGFLNLTQSAVSMQLKRLEEALGLQLLDRSARSVSLTAAGDQLMGYARRMVDLNDEVLSRLTDDDYKGEIVIGVPEDILYPGIPQVLNRFHAEFPRMKVQLVSSYTNELKSLYGSGAVTLYLATEDEAEPGGETLAVLPLRWIGAPDGRAWRHRPLRVAFCNKCRFRQPALRALDNAGIPWEMAIESGSDRAIEATIGADLAVGAMLEGHHARRTEPVAHGGALPELSEQQINLYVPKDTGNRALVALADLIRQAYATPVAKELLRAG